VQKPVELAMLVLGAGWDEARLEAEMAEGHNRALRLPRAVRVYLTYSTAWVDDAGNVQFREDIYGRDAVLLAALAGR
jgi:murein L,D-transpeptidase YcbB/YkuD